MEKQIEELKQQLEKQCVINKELQRQNKDLGECQRGGVECGIDMKTLLRAETLQGTAIIRPLQTVNPPQIQK